jgi:Zn-dependent protease with chaperone function
MKLFPERLMHGLNMAQKIRLGPDQLPGIYRYLPAACGPLGIAEPEFYLEMNPRPNAYTYGDQRAFVTVTSGLIEDLNGHIACQHTLYHTMALMLLRFGASIFGPLAALSLPVQLALLYWYRRSELSADRAAAVIMRGSQPVVDVMIRLAGGSKSITGQIDVDLYMKQAEAYDKLMESQWDQFLLGLASAAETHPLLAVRTREIVRWCESDQFQRILSGTAKGGAQANALRLCASCGEPLQERWRFCGHCGAAVAAAAS